MTNAPSLPSYPKLRSVQPQPTHYNGELMYMLRDPLQLANQAVLMPAPLSPLLYLLDGQRSMETIQTVLSVHFGTSFDGEVLADFIRVLDEVYLLDNERAAQAKKKTLRSYREAPFRPPALAGLSYPRDPKELYQQLQDLLESAEAKPNPAPTKGLLSPHIDYPRGGGVYAEVWKRALPTIREADLVVMLGTDHNAGYNPVTLTRQHYATPYGILPTDLDIVNALADALGEDMVFNGELFHRSEHSLELVAVWLHHIREQNPVPIVPILVGAFPEHTYNGKPMSENTVIPTLVDTLRRHTAGKKVVFVISGDLSHVGTAFDGDPMDDAGMLRIREQDHILLEAMHRGEAETFYEKIQATRDANNVCGTSPIYIAMRIMGEVQGELVAYDQCPADDAGTSIVSIGGMVFH